MTRRPSYWFPARRDGRGRGFPVAWQGWVVLTAYVAPMIANALAAALFAIGFANGEPARWRWGE